MRLPQPGRLTLLFGMRRPSVGHFDAAQVRKASQDGSCQGFWFHRIDLGTLTYLAAELLWPQGNKDAQVSSPSIVGLMDSGLN